MYEKQKQRSREYFVNEIAPKDSVDFKINNCKIQIEKLIRIIFLKC